MKIENQISRNSIAAIILSAGKSERFGKPKCFLSFDSSTSFLEKLLQEYTDAHINNIVIVLNEELKKKAEIIIKSFNKKSEIIIIINKHPEEGRFTSIKLGANAVEKYSSAFIQNIDNPFTTSPLIEKMKSKLENGKYVVPVCNAERGHPVLLSSEILNHIRKTSDTNTNLRDILNEYECVELKTNDERIHANINSEIEYQKYFAHETIH